VAEKTAVLAVLGRTYKVVTTHGLRVEAFPDLGAQSKRKMPRKVNLVHEHVPSTWYQMILSAERQIQCRLHPGAVY
jgi:hypothetical protein